MVLQNRWLVLALVSSALFLIGIDMTVLYTALPTLTHELDASASQKLWIVNAFPLVMAGLLPGFGTLGDRIGHRRIFTIGLVLFGAASVFAAYAPNANALILGRGLLAVGAALMMPATLSLIRLTFTDDKERAFALGVWGALFSGAAAVGPIIGGALLEHFWWGSVFLINVPVVVIALALARFLLAASSGNRERQWDVVGSVLIMIALVGLVYALKEAVRPDRNNVHLITAFLTGLLFGLLFVRRQNRRPVPLIDFTLFRVHGFRVGIIAALASAIALIGVELAFSQQLQLVQGLAPLQAGLFLMPIALSAFLAGPIAGLALPHLGIARTITLGLLLGGLGLAGFAILSQQSATLEVLMLILFGFGGGAAMSAASAAIMLSSPEHKAGMAASMEGVTYELGGTLGIAILGSMLTAIYAANLVIPDSIDIPAIVYDSIDQALIVAGRFPPDIAAEVTTLARRAFDQAFIVVVWFGAALQFAAAAYVALSGRALNPPAVFSNKEQERL